jgi:hypothetical protein
MSSIGMKQIIKIDHPFDNMWGPTMCAIFYILWFNEILLKSIKSLRLYENTPNHLG